jgi:putative aldouronate transport system permease protein
MEPINLAAKNAIKRTNPGVIKRFTKQWDLQLMVLPALAAVFIFSYIPMYGVLTAFQEFSIFDGFWASPWVGFEHFEYFFTSSDFGVIMRNTIVISFLKFFIGFPAPIILALMLNEVRNMAFKRFVQTVTYLPNFISWVIVSGLVISLLSVDNGSINIMLVKLGLINEPIGWLNFSEYFWGILISANVWKTVGFASIVYLAAIAGVNPQLYEAAQMDGASRFKQIRHITIPSIMPVIILFMILAIGELMTAGFEDILLLAKNPAIWDVSDSIDVYVYREGIEQQRFSYATAVGLFRSVISVALLTIANYAARKSGNSLW